jgi:hypothetical protein
MHWLMAVIVHSVLLSSMPAAAADLAVSDAAVTRQCPPPPRIRLAGTTISDGEIPAKVLVEDLDSGQQQLLALNSPLGAFRVSGISADEVVLSGDGCSGRVSLALTEGLAGGGAHLSGAVVFGSPDSTLIADVKPGSIFERLGIRRGDTLTAVNGRGIENAASARTALSAVDDHSLDSISVRRDGQSMVFVNPESTAVRNFRPPAVRPKGDGDASAQLMGGAQLIQREDR